MSPVDLPCADHCHCFSCDECPHADGFYCGACLPYDRWPSVGSLCTGIGGLDMAVQSHFGAETVWYSEIEKALVPWLAELMDPAPNLGDLKLIDWATVPPIDILTAGYPCQPFSHAGKREGTDDPRHLWPYILEGVRHLRPSLVVLENVRGHLTLGFDAVLGSLAEAGFDAEWCVLRASDVGAPHRRERVWIVASDANHHEQGAERRGGNIQGGEHGAAQHAAPFGGDRHALDLLPTPTAHLGGGRGTPNRETARRRMEDEGRRNLEDAVALLPTPVVNDMGANKTPEQWDAWRAAMREKHGNGNGHGPSLSIEAQRGEDVWGKYEPAIRRWEGLTRPAPAHTVDGKLSARFVEWMMGYPAGWLRGMTRQQELKALGNAVVPQQASAALRELVGQSPRWVAA